MEIRFSTFGRRVKEAIAAAGTDIRTISKQMGMSYEGVRRFAAGETIPRPKNLQKLADLLGVKVDYLLRESEELGELPTKTQPTIDNGKDTSLSTEDWERIETFLSKQNPDGFKFTVLANMNGKIWATRKSHGNLDNPPRFVLMLSGKVDDLLDALL